MARLAKEGDNFDPQVEEVGKQRVFIIGHGKWKAKRISLTPNPERSIKVILKELAPCLLEFLI